MKFVTAFVHNQVAAPELHVSCIVEAPSTCNRSATEVFFHKNGDV